MFWKKKTPEIDVRAELEAMRVAITGDVLAQVREMLAMDRVSPEGHPRCDPLSLAVRNIDIANLNLKFFGYDLARRVAQALPPHTDTSARFVGRICVRCGAAPSSAAAA